MTLRPLLAAALVALAVPALAQTEAPATIAYQGVLADATGAPVPDGTYDLTLRLWNAATGGTALYVEAHAAATVGGVFAVEIGGGTPTGPPFGLLDFDRQLWLGVEVEGVAVGPRTALRAVPYARSLTPGAAVEGDRAGGSVLALSNTNDAGIAHGLLAETYGTLGQAVTGTARASTGSSVGVSGIAWAPGGRGVSGYAASTTGADAVGVHGQAASTDGTAVRGVADALTGLARGGHFSTASNLGEGVLGEATAAVGVTVGVRGRVESPDGYAAVFEGGRGVYVDGDLVLSGEIVAPESDDGWHGGFGAGDFGFGNVGQALRGGIKIGQLGGFGEEEGGAGLLLRRPAEWDETATVVLTLWLRAETERPGRADLAVRVRSFEPGVPTPEAASFPFAPADLPGGPDTFVTTQVEIPPEALRGGLWELTVVRGADDYPDDVVMAWCDVDVRR